MNWNILDNKLIKEISFKNQTELAEFLLKVAKLADENDHHPDVEIYQCSRLRLKLFTHTENGISELDRKLAKLIDLL
jgi:4a-hydroxytetrahydrobiopterin dehydratase